MPNEYSGFWFLILDFEWTGTRSFEYDTYISKE